MKTLLALLLTLGGGAGVGVAAVAGVEAAMDPDSSIQQTSDQQVDVLQYGQNG